MKRWNGIAVALQKPAAESHSSVLHGPITLQVGYTGGNSSNPNYETVCRGDGHTEAMRVWFDPSVISYRDILMTFFAEHDAFRPKKAQYKSAIWYTSGEQLEVAQSLMEEMGKMRGNKPATTLDPADEWWDAEEYHQKYFNKGSRSLWG
eukprot:gene8316-1591_t